MLAKVATTVKYQISAYPGRSPYPATNSRSHEREAWQQAPCAERECPYDAVACALSVSRKASRARSSPSARRNTSYAYCRYQQSFAIAPPQAPQAEAAQAMPPSPATARWDRYAHPYTTLDVFILSARFGLITAAHPIPNYDQRMTPERTRDLRPAIVATLAQIFDAKTYNRAHLAVGKDYLAALDGLLGAISREATITVATGSQCKRLAQLHDWLYELETPAASRSPETRRTRQHRENSRLNGVEITLTADQALAHARQAVAADSHGCDRFRSWYVLLDEERIAPKWLVSRFSGLSVGAFTTQEALRALAQIGITVHCVESL